VTASLRRLRIGTRRSDLARWQSNHVVAGISGLAGAPSLEMLYIKTEGDRITDVPLHMIPGKSFFTKEIEQALLDEQVDVAVHSLKDLATEMPRGLVIGAVMEREDPRDVLLSHGGISLEDLTPGARIGTSSLRRRALLRRWRPDLELVDLRGNVPTRIHQLSEGRFDAIVLAAAGVKRLDFESRITAYLPLERVLPAVAQGAVALQVREDDEYVLRWVRQLDDADTRQATAAERALLGRLEGGCQVPVGALATVTNGVLTLRAVVSSLDGTRSIEGTREGPSDQAEQIGGGLAEELLGRGAEVILDEIRATTGDVG
jgi:hydroxymethylbilane synthase